MFKSFKIMSSRVVRESEPPKVKEKDFSVQEPDNPGGFSPRSGNFTSGSGEENNPSGHKFLHAKDTSYKNQAQLISQPSIEEITIEPFEAGFPQEKGNPLVEVSIPETGEPRLLLFPEDLFPEVGAIAYPSLIIKREPTPVPSLRAESQSTESHASSEDFPQFEEDFPQFDVPSYAIEDEEEVVDGIVDLYEGENLQGGYEANDYVYAIITLIKMEVILQQMEKERLSQFAKLSPMMTKKISSEALWRPYSVLSSQSLCVNHFGRSPNSYSKSESNSVYIIE